MTHPWNKLSNVRRRVNRARNHPGVTCPATRHVHMMADCLSKGRKVYPLLQEEPEHCAGSLYATVETAWKLRAENRRLWAENQLLRAALPADHPALRRQR